MTKITSPQLHRGDNADLQFGACVIGVIREVRRSMRALAESRRADEAAPGAIYALQKLCEGNDGSNVFTQEAEQWQATFFAWLDRVQRHIPKEYVETYRANAEEAFRVILEASHYMPESLWRNEANQRHLLISFPNDEAFRHACDAADEQHPVKPGHALSKYLERCARELTQDSTSRPVEEKPPPPKRNNSFAPRYLLGPDGTHSLLVTEKEL